MNPLLIELGKDVYAKYLKEGYGVGKGSKLNNEDYLKLWFRFKYTQNQLKININEL